MSFTLGQRWSVNTEPELGLGTIVAIEERTVSVLFPIIGETRVYAKNNSPLIRVEFNLGDQVICHEGWVLTVEHIVDDNGLLTYEGTRVDSGEKASFKETLIDPNFKAVQPQERLLNGQVERSDWFTMRYRALQAQYAYLTSQTMGLQGARVSLINHQLHIANEVGRRYSPRVLLADEVGLGKTIEAGLIIHQQLKTYRARRVLVVVPESLQYQWLVEMLRKFNLAFSVFDKDRCDESSTDGENPFDTEQLVICSLGFLASNSINYQQALEASWDLLVVDEAHHLEWHADKPSQTYTLVEQLAMKTRGCLLLTATPDQLGHESHFARLRLLDPSRFHDYQDFVEEEKSYSVLAEVLEFVSSPTAPNSQQIDQLNHILHGHLADDINLLSDPKDSGIRQQAQGRIIEHLLDLHGTGRILFRNSRANISGFPYRSLNAYPLAWPESLPTANDDANLPLTYLLQPERIWTHVESQWWKLDPRVDWVLNWLKENKSTKALLVCATAQTAMDLEEALRTREGIRCSDFHEGMSIIERDKASAYFADEENGAQVLICSEIGSEGRNFQFAHHLILFDLPLNPDVLEQRIGRLDRIGQLNDIQIHVPYFEGTAQDVMLNWYHKGLNAFEHTCAIGGTLYEEVSEVLTECLLAPKDADSTESLLKQTKTLSQVLRTQLEQGRDKLLELNSSGLGKVEPLIEALKQEDKGNQLQIFMSKVFDTFGVNCEDRDEDSYILQPSEEMYTAFPCLPDEGMTITYDRRTALTREDIHYLTWDHPMVEGVFDLVFENEKGNSAVSLMTNKKLPVGTFFLELIFVFEAAAPAELQLHRFLPATPVRVLLDAKGNNLADKVPFETFEKQLKSAGKKMSLQLIQALGNNIKPLFSQGEKLAETQAMSLKASSLEKVEAILSSELARLSQLREVNPNIREEELEFLALQKGELLTLIQQASVRMDSARLVVNTHS